jgi:3-phenylpropionate/cinnamic acid dioxygenase small subunit
VRPVSDAHEQIRNLLGRYCEAMDAADWAGLGELFAEGALTDGDGNGLARGAEAVSAMYAGMVQLHDGSPRTRHLTVNPVLEVDGDTATGRSSFLVLQQLMGGPLQPIAAGRYRDRFTCRDGTWSFAVRAFELDQIGDLSRHLGA